MIEIWRTWYGKNAPYRRRSGDVAYVVLHHTASPSTQSPEAIRRHHERDRGWPHMGYHYLVYEDGTVFKTLPLVAVPICVREHNPVAVCVAAVGNFSPGAPGWRKCSPGYRTLWGLALQLKTAYPQAKLVLHKDLVPTGCPGILTWAMVEEEAKCAGR